MHSTKSALLLIALALSASCVVSSPQPELGLEDLWDSLNRTGQVIIDGLVDATKNGTAITEEFLDTVKNATSQFSDETVQFAQKIAEAVHKAVTDGITDFSSTLRSVIDRLRGGIDRVRNVLKRKALKDALATLQSVDAAVSDLEGAVNNLYDKMDEKKQEYAAEIQEKWGNWAAAQLERVDQQTNGVGNEEAEEVINELVDRYSGYLQSCVEELQVHHAVYEKNVHQAIAKYHNATNVLSSKIESCLRSPLGVLSCQNGIGQALNGLDSAPSELVSLKLQGLRLLGIGLDASGCVGQTLAEHELEKPSVERKLNEIIKRYLNQKGSTVDDDSSSEEKPSTDGGSDAQEEDNSSNDDNSSDDNSSDDNES
ncbi:uncharacterized protein LOC108149550 [Drosophila elegans]|uniref:uncharacterized protein LOC108149550 n=1 Tax=Drosophila elegans TaxID=30023 RepID=UPI0007E7D6D0|nr:uncharacterized protein LOC108149550 [Drosophila elegans]